jgi:hypothetical protein
VVWAYFKVPPLPSEVRLTVAVTVVPALLSFATPDIEGAEPDAADRVILTEPKELDQVEAFPPEATFLLV